MSFFFKKITENLHKDSQFLHHAYLTIQIAQSGIFDKKTSASMIYGRFDSLFKLSGNQFKYTLSVFNVLMQDNVYELLGRHPREHDFAIKTKLSSLQSFCSNFNDFSESV